MVPPHCNLSIAFSKEIWNRNFSLQEVTQVSFRTINETTSRLWKNLNSCAFMQNVNTDLFFEDSEAGICNLFLKNNQTHDGNVSKILKTQPCLFWLLSFFHYFVVNGLGFIFIFFLKIHSVQWESNTSEKRGHKKHVFFCYSFLLWF